MVKCMPIFDFEHDSVCQGYTLENNVKKSLSNSNTRSKGLLDLIHFDVCGPMSSPSLSVYLYYVLFIHDFFRKSWIYLLKAKNETFSKYQEYKLQVENQTGKHIHDFKFENGGEFDSHDFNEFCSDA